MTVKRWSAVVWGGKVRHVKRLECRALDEIASQCGKSGWWSGIFGASWHFIVFVVIGFSSTFVIMPMEWVEGELWEKEGRYFMVLFSFVEVFIRFFMNTKSVSCVSLFRRRFFIFLFHFFRKAIVIYGSSWSARVEVVIVTTG